MYRSYQTIVLSIVMLVSILLLSPANSRAEGITINHTHVSKFDLIPHSTIEEIDTSLWFYYGHTSHGSQIISGLGIIQGDDPLYDPPLFYEPVHDLGGLGDTSWAKYLRIYFDNTPQCNMAMMSWCSGVSGNTEDGINAYLYKMTELETEYPNITFIYMTGHLDGTGIDGNLYIRNNQIRDYCSTNGKILFDFADIESWDPDGIFYPDETDGCNWCYDWCATHTCPPYSYCAHSHVFNCYQKGKAFWVLMAWVAGWSLIADVDTPDEPILPETVRLHQNYPNPFNPVTEIWFELPRAANVKLTIFNITGQEVATVADSYYRAGHHSVEWDGSACASGVYLYRLDTNDFTETRKLVLLK